MSTVKESARTEADFNCLVEGKTSVFLVLQHLGHYQGYTPCNVFLTEKEAIDWIKIQQRVKDYRYKEIRVK